jgi:hypothetical protein
MLNQVRILDHIIIGNDGYYSFQSSGKISAYEKESKDIISNRKHGAYEKVEDIKYHELRSDSDDKE